MKFTRRTFLKGLVSGVAVATIPGLSSDVSFDELWVKTGKIREITAYNIGNDEIMTRFDIYDGKRQFNCSSITTGIWRDSKKMGEIRDLSYDVLNRVMRENNIKYEDLVELSMPDYVRSLT